MLNINGPQALRILATNCCWESLLHLGFLSIIWKVFLSSGFKSHLAHYLSMNPKKYTKRIQSKKKTLYFGKWTFLALIFKKFLCFLPRKFFLIFSRNEFFSYFWKPSLAQDTKKSTPKKNYFISGNWTQLLFQLQLKE